MLFDVFEILVVTLCCVASSIQCIHVFQLERYRMPGYRQWLARNKERHIRGNVLVGFVSALLSGYLPIFLSLFISVERTRNAIANATMLLGFVLLTALTAYRRFHEASDKPLMLNSRTRRMFIVAGVLQLASATIVSLVRIPPYIVYAAPPYAVWLAGIIMDPIEKRANAGYYEEAREKLRARSDLITIGITGSAGKTLTKFILQELLSRRYQVLATPASYNTPMGISRCVIEQLEKRHQVFIAEMGAQHKGDIRQLVKLVRPKYGMITSIGKRHVETFGSVANIVDGKNELILGLPEDAKAFFASDNGYCDRLFGMCEREKYNAGIDRPDCYMQAVQVSFGSKGTTFMLECANGEKIRCRTRLLGRYNVQNIALAAAVAHQMGLSMEEIGEGISRLKSFEKKLQLIPGRRTVIDDRLNADPEGAAEALSVLSEFSGRRILVTPGLPGGGERADEFNHAFGTQITGCADVVILIGDRKKLAPILRGLHRSRFIMNAVHVVADMNDANDMLEQISSDGDAVLYECEAEE